MNEYGAKSSALCTFIAFPNHPHQSRRGRSRRYVRAALLCVTCDVPAARKVGGIVGHSALMFKM